MAGGRFLRVLGGNLTTVGNEIVLNGGGTALVSNVQLSTGAAVGDVTLDNPVNGAFNLSILAGTGAVNVNQPVEGGAALGLFDVLSSSNTSFMKKEKSTHCATKS